MTTREKSDTVDTPPPQWTDVFFARLQTLKSRQTYKKTTIEKIYTKISLLKIGLFGQDLNLYSMFSVFF